MSVNMSSKTWRELAGEVSIIGAGYVFDENVSRVRRCAWALFILFGICFSTYLVAERIRTFVSCPVTVNVDIVRRDVAPLPAITLCRIKFQGRSWFAENNITEKLVPFARFWSTYVGENPLSGLEHNNLREFAMRDFIQQCVFRVKPCNISEFTILHHFGGCISTASLENRFITQGTGLVNSLGLEAIVNHNETLSEDGQQGLFLIIGKRGELYVKDYTPLQVIPSSHHVHISLRERRISVLPRAGVCTAEETYSQPTCLSECEKRVLLEACGCILPYNFKAGYISCYQNTSLFLCFFSVYFNLPYMNSRCDCPPSCETIIYDSTITSAPYHKENLTDDSIEYTQLYIYFSELNYEHTFQIEAYTFVALLTDIGGALGLFLGSAIYTLLQILDYSLVVTSQARRGFLERRRISVS